MKKKILYSHILFVTLLASLLALHSISPTDTYAQTAPAMDDWLNTKVESGITSNLLNPNYCVDPTRPATLLYYKDSKTMRYNWATGKTSEVANFLSSGCPDANGYIFGWNYQNKQLRYNFYTEKTEIIAHNPTITPKFGGNTTDYYYLEQEKNLLVSVDAGLNWTEVKTPKNIGAFWDIAVSGKTLYAFVTEPIDVGKAEPDRNFVLYVTQDRGQTWQKTFEHQEMPRNTYGARNWNLQGMASLLPDNFIILANSLLAGSHSGFSSYLSTDWGKTITEIKSNGPGICSISPAPQTTVLSRMGIVRFEANHTCGKTTNIAKLEITLDGKNYQALTLPPETETPDSFSSSSIQALGNTLFFYGFKNIWKSSDVGKSWQKVGSSKPVTFAINAEPDIFVGGDWYLYNQSNEQKTVYLLTGNCQLPVASNSDMTFSETGQTLSSLFRPYWEKNGGLAQFGYPTTGVFCEKNPSDGKVYPVQYFERNRFEYHAENKGTNYEVLLGLLGVQLTETHRAAKHGAFNRFDNQKYPSGLYFSETGHNLRNSFKDYWEKNGGLAIYGYPISEEFEEVNPDDGKTYIVQYFERNRFEYHSENKGTRYEVLLGLLGNSLLREKKWV